MASATLVTASVGAQPAGREAEACVPGTRSPMTEDYERTSRAEDWPQEAQRLRADVPNVSRREDRLWLAIDGGTAVELQDCPYGEAGYRYLYERYDDPGRFYVVRTPRHDDFAWTLVMKSFGLAVHGSRRAGLGDRQEAVPDRRLLAPAGARQA